VAGPARRISHTAMDGGQTHELAISGLGITDEGKD
jgi:hypothetical protein